MLLPYPIIEVLMTFRPLFTTPTWRKLMILLSGTLLAQGRRTVAAALRHADNSMAGNLGNFHPVLDRARSSPLAGSRRLLPLIVAAFVSGGERVGLGIDSTL